MLVFGAALFGAAAFWSVACWAIDRPGGAATAVNAPIISALQTSLPFMLASVFCPGSIWLARFLYRIPKVAASRDFYPCLVMMAP
jgi:hypothetical protein